MPPRASTDTAQYDFSGKNGQEKFFAIIKAIQEETVREYVSRAHLFLGTCQRWKPNYPVVLSPQLERSDYLMKEDIDAAWKVIAPNGRSQCALS